MYRDRGCLINTLLFLVIVFVPVVGQLIETFMVLEDDHSFAGTGIWLVIIWFLPFIGPFLYLFFGQKIPKRGRIMFGQPSR